MRIIFRRRRLLIAIVTSIFLFGIFLLFRISGKDDIRIGDLPTIPESSEELRENLRSLNDDQIEYLSKPRTLPEANIHPVEYLTKNAQREFDQVLRQQSKTLEEAVKEYRRRYGFPPPPHFDKWFEFARENAVQLVDEFDTIHDLITPFWGMTPKLIRHRAREALGYNNGNGLIGIAIRKHKVAFIENPNGAEWQQNATVDMLSKFIQYLPDMDLAFNVHDEPRVVLQHDDLARLVHKAKRENMPAANATLQLVNSFTASVPDLGNEMRFSEAKQTRFRSAAHQPTWTTSRMSCPPDSPARILEDDEVGDDASKYAITDAGFIYNVTAMMDICLSPSLSTSFGFFERPNGYFVAHDLFPIFSQSKVSSYSDIIYPSPWYWQDKAVYNETRDFPWANKNDQLYWRGSTTGGFSRDGGWTRQHRQRFVHKINTGPTGSEYEKLINVRFSHVGQCDPKDCEAQIKHFKVKDMTDMQDAWGYKFLLDMDGNAFSGRFYAFLQSHSQVFKQALFQEWHMEWLKPWLHYVPLSMRGNDWFDLVRYYNATGNEAENMAKTSRDWAGKAVRKVDMEAWFFRLLLE